MMSGIACAGGETMAAPMTPAPMTHAEFGSFLELSAVYAETTLRFPNGESNANTAGLRVAGAFEFGSGFSLNSRFQYLEDDGDGKSYDVRGILNYSREFMTGLSWFIGAGYQYHNVDVTDDFNTENQAVLANLGVEYQSGPFLTTFTYIQGFTNSSQVDVFGNHRDLDNADTGTLELMTAYQVSSRLSVTASASAELLQEASITDDWSVGLGLRYDF
jgi:hypothetical protein